MIWILIYLLTVFVSSLLIYKKKDGFLFYFIIALAFIAPYSSITGLSLYSVFVRIIIPGFVFTYTLWKFNDLKLFIRYSFKEYLKYTILVFGLYIVIILFDVLFLHIKVTKIPVNYFVKYYELFWSISFFLILFARLNGERRTVVFNQIHFIILLVGSLVGFLTYLKVPLVYTFHEKMYNFTFIIYDEKRELFDFVRWYNRPNSIFSAANQFGLFASLSLIISKYMYDEKIIGNKKMVINVILQVLILVSSQSRTGFIFYFLIIGLLYLRGTNYKRKLILIPILLPFFIIVYFVLPERIMNLFSGKEGLIEALGYQRIYFWFKFFNSLTWESIFNGMPRLIERDDFTFFESGYFNIYFEGGLGLLLLHFIHIRKIGNFKIKNLKIKNFAVPYSTVFILSEILQGTFITKRYALLNGMVIAYLIIKKFETDSVDSANKVETQSDDMTNTLSKRRR